MLDLFRQVNWAVFLPHGILVAIFVFILILFGLETDLALLTGSFIYLGLSLVLQRVVPFHHRMGYKLLMQKDYEKAKLAFQNSWDYFQKRPWMDNYRSIFMLSASKMSYREMALINRALCFWQNREDEKAKEAYSEVLKYFPDSKMAKEAIAYIENPEPEEEEAEEETEKNDSSYL
jgi:hypothetical protein